MSLNFPVVNRALRKVPTVLEIEKMFLIQNQDFKLNVLQSCYLDFPQLFIGPQKVKKVIC